MAWNEPGNSNDQDPWGGGGRKGGGNNGKGPPDLDEALRKLQESLNRIFNSTKKSGSSGNRNGGNGTGLLGSAKAAISLAIVLLLAIWLYNAVFVVDEQEQAVVLRFGRYHETLGPGLHLYLPPIDRRFQENVTRERAYSKQGLMLTQDENIVDVPVTVQYRISDLHNYVINDDDPERALQYATDSALRHVVGSSTMDQVLTEGREAIAAQVRERLQEFLDNYQVGITVTQVNIQNAAAPQEVQEAFDNVIRAREDEQRERNRAETYANGVIPEARGEAKRLLEEANGYRSEVVDRAQGEADRFRLLLAEYRKAPEVTRERMYLASIERVLKNSSKVLMTAENKGQNNMLYLPLDKMLEKQPAASSSVSTLTLPSRTSKSSSASASDDNGSSNRVIDFRDFLNRQRDADNSASDDAGSRSREGR